MPVPEEFLKKTRIFDQGMTDQLRGKEPPPVEMPRGEAIFAVDLPELASFNQPESKLADVANTRHSSKSYSDRNLQIEELSSLLWYTQGVKKYTRSQTMRMVPSAGARHPFETFLYANKVKGIDKGLYRYFASEHKLLCNKKNDLTDEFVSACLQQDFIAQSAILFIWAADIYRMRWRYGDRSYRYVFIESGHICQNLYLFSQALDCACCAIGAYDDDRINQLLNIDGKSMFAVYMASLGKKREKNE